MKLQDVQEHIHQRMGLIIGVQHIRDRIDEFLPDAERTDGGHRELTEEQAEIITKVYVLRELGLSNEDIESIVSGKKAMSSIITTWMDKQRICDIVKLWIDDEKKAEEA